MAEINTPYISFGAAVEAPLRMRFKDGEHAIPGFMVAAVGGPEELTKSASSLAQITFAEFARAYSEEQVGNYLRRVQAQFLGEHLRGSGRHYGNL